MLGFLLSWERNAKQRQQQRQNKQCRVEQRVSKHLSWTPAYISHHHTHPHTSQWVIELCTCVHWWPHHETRLSFCPPCFLPFFFNWATLKNRVGWLWDFYKGILDHPPPGFGTKIFKIEPKLASKSEKPPDRRIRTILLSFSRKEEWSFRSLPQQFQIIQIDRC